MRKAAMRVVVHPSMLEILKKNDNRKAHTTIFLYNHMEKGLECVKIEEKIFRFQRKIHDLLRHPQTVIRKSLKKLSSHTSSFHIDAYSMTLNAKAEENEGFSGLSSVLDWEKNCTSRFKDWWMRKSFEKDIDYRAYWLNNESWRYNLDIVSKVVNLRKVKVAVDAVGYWRDGINLNIDIFEEF